MRLFSINLSIIVILAFLFIAAPADIFAKKWDIEADSVELTEGDIDRPYEIKEIVSFKIKRQLAEESALEARDRLRKTAADKGCDAVIFVDHYAEKVKNHEIILEQGDINYPYKIRSIADVVVADSDEPTMRNVDGQLTDLAKKNRGQAVIFILYQRAGTEVNGAKGIIVRFPRRWLREAESTEKDK
jgi:hypothetical protein